MVLTTVNFNIVVRTAALLIIGLCGQCISKSPIVRLYAFGRTLYPGSWLSQALLAFAPKDRKFAAISTLQVGLQPAIPVPGR